MPEAANAFDVYELRSYTIRPGQRMAFVELFEREFIEPQEACGIGVLGQFRDLDRPDMFVWIRAFRDMGQRPDALSSFYGGPVWARHRDVANNMMLDSDDVLMLENVRPPRRLEASCSARDSGAPGRHTYVVATYPVRDASTECIAEAVSAMDRIVAEHDAEVVGAWSTAAFPNNFPKLPVRDETALVLMCRARSAAGTQQQISALVRGADWQDLSGALADIRTGPAHTMCLSPTRRSTLA